MSFKNINEVYVFKLIDLKLRLITNKIKDCLPIFYIEYSENLNLKHYLQHILQSTQFFYYSLDKLIVLLF